ncbi:MAG TPA: hypothetical protein VLU25_09870 [Acidobacteriota bacterium]|nr:hypothetical protein [Acidobacteriota bacterium]
MPCWFLLTAVLLFAMPTDLLLGQEEEEQEAEPKGQADPWGPLKLLVGTWEGEISGKLGTGKGLRRYRFILGDRFLESRHVSVRLPQEKSPEGDQHEELGVFSYDSQQKRLVYREFMKEGVVVRSACEVDGMKVVCTSEAVESGPGIRARLTLEISDAYRFTEIYHLGWPGRELEHYFTNRWTRTVRPHDWD